MNFKKTIVLLTCCAVLGMSCTACGWLNGSNTSDRGDVPDNSYTGGVTDGEITDDNDVTIPEPDATEHDYRLVSQSGGRYTYKCEDCGDEATVVISRISGTNGAYTVEGNTITFSGVTQESAYDITGTFYGNIVIDVSDSYKFELQMTGFEMYSYTECPVTVSSGDKVTLSAKKSTENFIYDMREAVDENDDAVSASVYAQCDLDVQGKGDLTVKSVNNNGIHTKDDLNVKNLSLQVDCKANALKGNDSVTIESGSVTLIARQGDGIKTTNSDVSSKGNQRGTVAITGGDVLIYAACDGIDAAYDVTVDESSASVFLQIFTDKYSKYSEEVTAVSDSVYYIRFNSTAYKYSLKFYNDETDYVWCNSSSSTTVGMNRYFPIDKPNGYAYVQLFIYSSTQQQGQGEDYVACTEGLTVNNNYDTIALQTRGNSLTYSWTNYTTNNIGGGMGGMGGFGGIGSGNTDKGDHSTKGIKADNAVCVSAGIVTVSAYDDAIHADSGVSLENGNSSVGNVTISGGTVIISSNDDGLHADGALTVSGGAVSIISSYEGVEGNTVHITGGQLSVTSSDDGINGAASSGTSISISGGKVYVFAGGDGLDANSRTANTGIVFSGGRTVIISTGNSESSIDTENGYTYTSGYVVGVNRSGGLGNESLNCSNFSSVGTSKTLGLQADGYLVVNDIATVKMPVTMNSLVVCLGRADASIASSATTGFELDGNGVYWVVS